MKFKITFWVCPFSILILLIISCTTSKNIQRQLPKPNYIPTDKLLYETITKQDSLLFVAFNAKNITGLKSFFTDKLEVYQDNTGLRNYGQTIEAFTGLFKMEYTLTRTPIIKSIEVYPIKNYGAIETGQHTFCHTENNKLECATFKFVDIWEQKDGQWKLSKIITYGHNM